MNLWIRIRHIWLVWLFIGGADNLFNLVRRLPTIPAHPVSAVLWATLAWVAFVWLLWAIDIQLMLIARCRRPQAWVVRDGATLPVSFKSLGYDPYGSWSWLVTGTMQRDDELLIDLLPRGAALYLLQEGTTAVARISHDDGPEDSRRLGQ